MATTKMSRRSFVRAALGTASLGVLAACVAPIAPATSGEAQDAAAQTGGDQAATVAGQTFTAWTLQYDPHINQWNDLLEAFREHAGAEGALEPISGIGAEKLITSIAANTVPDVGTFMGKTLLPLWSIDAVLAIDESVYDAVGIDVNTFFGPGAIGAYEWQGKHYGVPFEDNSVANFMAARLDWIEEVGAEDLWPPTHGKDRFESFDEVWELAKALHLEESGVVTRWGLSRAGWEGIAIPSIMRGLGQDWWDPDERRFYLDSEAGIETLRLYAEIPTQELMIETELNESGFNAMMQNKAAVVQGTGSLPRRASEIGLQVEEVMAPPPVAGDPPLYVGEGGWGLVVPTQAANKDAALELCRFACSAETQMIWTRGGTTPACTELYNDPFFEGDDPVKRSMRRVIQTLQYTKYLGTGYGSTAAVGTVMSSALPKLRTGEVNSEQAAQEIQAGLEEELRKWDES